AEDEDSPGCGEALQGHGQGPREAWQRHAQPHPHQEVAEAEAEPARHHHARQAGREAREAPPPGL
ncbi:MAG: LSU ribosomal protein L35p, partial [uncultured Gemmatimonadetes bacterium]